MVKIKLTDSSLLFLPESGASSPTVSSPAPTLKQSAAHNENVTTHVSDDEDRLENMLSRSYQQEQEALKTKNYTIVDTLSAKVQRLSESEQTVTPTTSEATADRGMYGRTCNYPYFSL